MDNTFEIDEKLYRAVYPPSHPGMFWKRDGSLSSAAFADRRGLSVDRGGGRKNEEAVQSMKDRFQGCIVSVRVGDCKSADAIIRHLPSASNPYHSEIHGSETQALLNKSQRFHLAQKAIVEYMSPT